MEAALQRFHKSLGSIKEITVDLDAQLPAALGDRALSDRLDLIRCSLVVIISGLLESFIRELAEAYIDNVNRRSVAYHQFPAVLRNTNLNAGAAILSLRVRQEKRGQATWILASSTSIAQRLGTVSTPATCVLLWEAFAETEANPSFRVIQQFLARFGIKQSGQKLEASSGVSRQLLETSLTSLVELRNECAHSGSSATVPTPSTIRGFCDTLEKLSDAVAEVLCDHLKQAPFVPKTILL